MKRGISIMLCVLLLLGLSGCGSLKELPASLSASVQSQTTTDDSAETQTLSGEESQGESSITLPEGEFVYQVETLGSQVYVSTITDSNDYACVYEVDSATGGLTKLYEVSSTTIQLICPLADGSFWLRLWDYDETAQTELTTLLYVDAQGQEVIHLTENDLTDANEILSVAALLPWEDDGVLVYAYLDDSSRLLAIDTQGNITASMDVENGGLSNLKALSNGQIVGVFQSLDALGNTEDVYPAVIDLAAQAIRPWIESDSLEGSLYPQVLCDDGQTAWLRCDDALYTYDMTTGQVEAVTTLVAAGINSINLKGMFLDESGALWAVIKEGDNSLTITSVKTTASERKTLTLATMGLSANARELVTAFNQENEEYYIEVKEYLSEGGNIYDSLEQFAYDVMSGDEPDIVDLFDMNYDSLLQKGLLLDLTPYVDGENGLDRSQYLESVFDANTDETGAMYSLIPNFSLSTLAGDPSVFGSAQGCTMERLEETAQTCADMGMVLFPCGSREDILYYLLPNITLENYIDHTTNTCSFNSQGFVDLLNFAATVPLSEKAYYSEYDYTLTSVAAARTYNLYSYSEYEIEEDLGPNFTLLGYLDGETLFTLSPMAEFAIFATTDEPDACWAFLRTFCEEFYQSGGSSEYLDGFPILNSCRETLAELFVTYGENTQENIDRIDQYLTQDFYISRRFTTTSEVQDIVIEEAEALFSGDKTAEQVAEMIQSRVSIYLSEQG